MNKKKTPWWITRDVWAYRTMRAFAWITGYGKCSGYYNHWTKVCRNCCVCEDCKDIYGCDYCSPVDPNDPFLVKDAFTKRVKDAL